MDWLRAIEPWVPWISRTLVFAWCLWITVWIHGQAKALVFLRQESKRLTAEVRSLQNQIGWDDSMTKTQHIAPEVVAQYRKK